MNSQEKPIEMREDIRHPQHFAAYTAKLAAIAILDIVLLTVLGICKTFFSPALDIPVLVLYCIAFCALPIARIFGEKKKLSMSRTAYRTVMACVALHSVAVICWAVARLISFFAPEITHTCYFLLWLPQIMSVYLMYLVMLMLRPGKGTKPTTILDVRDIDGTTCLWIHRQKVFSLDHEDFIDQRYAFPVAELDAITLGEEGIGLVLEGNAKYQVWPFYMGDKPDRLPAFADTAAEHTRIFLSPKNDYENARIAQFYNAIMQARESI